MSLAAGVLLALALWVLLAHSCLGKRLLLAASPVLLTVWLAGLAASWVMTALQAAVTLPDAARAFGLYVYPPGCSAVMDLLLQLAVAAVIAGLRRGKARRLERYGAEWLRSSNEGLTAPLLEHAAEAASPQPPLAEPEGGAAAVLNGLGYSSRLGRALQHLATMAAASIGRAAVLAAWQLGLYVLPLAWILVGASRLDAMHAAYLAFGLAYLLPAIVAPGAAVRRTAGRWYPRHLAIRLYASAHLLGVYAALCARLPGLDVGRWRAGAALQRALAAAGLWDTPGVADTLPVLTVLLSATIHAALGKYLAGLPEGAVDEPGAAAGDEPAPEQAEGQPSAAANWARSLELVCLALLHGAQRFCLGALSAAGPYPLLLLLYLMAVFNSPKGLLALFYLTHATVLFFTAFPVATSAVQVCNSNRAGSAPARHRFARLMHKGLLVKLAVLAACDLVVQYGLPLLHAYSADSILPTKVVDFLAYVVGVLPADLSVRLAWVARPASILVAVCIVRWAPCHVTCMAFSCAIFRCSARCPAMRVSRFVRVDMEM